jgi:hypothetical protein
MKLLRLNSYRPLAGILAISALLGSWAVETIALEDSGTTEAGIQFAPVGPITETQIPVVWDTDDRTIGGPPDMNGPRIGTVQYSQRFDGSLVLEIRLVFAHPLTTYQVFLVCGPSHDQACDSVTLGVLTTDGAGTGQAGFQIPVFALQFPPFRPGYRTDHIDLLQGTGDFTKGVLAAGAVNYYVPEAGGLPGSARGQNSSLSQRSPIDPVR